MRSRVALEQRLYNRHGYLRPRIFTGVQMFNFPTIGGMLLNGWDSSIKK